MVFGSNNSIMIIVKIIGGMGNQLFQYATGRALSIRYNTNLKLDLSFFNTPEYIKVFRLDKFNLKYSIANESDYIDLKNRDNIPKVIRILEQVGIKTYPYYKRSHLVENKILSLNKSKKSLNKNYYIQGWFGDENYFNEYREILVKEFNADNLLSDENKVIQNEIKNSNSIAVHIRRADYLTNSYFKTLPKEYYLCAMKKAIEETVNPVFYFFTDDIVWVKDQFSNMENVKIMENNSTKDTVSSTTGDIADLMLMKSCKHQIIANSTFSWWGAWLNENHYKKVFYSALWYNDIKAQKQFETNNNFVPSTWIKVNF